MYLYSMKEHSKAAKELESALNLFERECSALIEDVLKGESVKGAKIKIKKYIRNLMYTGLNYYEMKIK